MHMENSIPLFIETVNRCDHCFAHFFFWFSASLILKYTSEISRIAEYEKVEYYQYSWHSNQSLLDCVSFEHMMEISAVAASFSIQFISSFIGWIVWFVSLEDIEHVLSQFHHSALQCNCWAGIFVQDSNSISSAISDSFYSLILLRPFHHQARQVFSGMAHYSFFLLIIYCRS